MTCGRRGRKCGFFPPPFPSVCRLGEVWVVLEEETDEEKEEGKEEEGEEAQEE